VAHALAQPAGHWNNPAANHVPFVIERLFSTFLLRNPHYKSRAYEHPIEVYIRKFGAECGTVIHALSRVKESIADYGDPGHRRWQALRSVVGNNYKHLNLPSLDDPPV
jgi:hypothetical protein